MSEQMYCSVCKKDVDPEVYDDGRISYCPICHTGYREVSYEAHMRELEDEHAVLSEFENETSPKVVPANKTCSGQACTLCNDTGYITIDGEVWGACDCKRLPLT